MTKEEILSKHIGILPKNIKPDGAMLQKDAITAMEDYSRLNCIAFANWINETNWAEKETWGKHDPPSIPTTAELYEIFSQSQK